MRCIEINMSALVAIRTHGLTLTWDVLKSYTHNLPPNELKININMRCIEIYGKLL